MPVLCKCGMCGSDFVRSPSNVGAYCSHSCASKRRRSLADRFWSRVAKDILGCWSWTGSLDTHGYGRISEVAAPPYCVDAARGKATVRVTPKDRLPPARRALDTASGIVVT